MLRVARRPSSLAWPLLSSVALMSAALLACGPGEPPLQDLTTTETGPGDGDPGDGDGDDTGPGDGDPVNLDPSPNVDLLIVIDNSGSMGEEQAALATSIDALVDALEAANADYRVAVTTSDNGNPWCPSGSTTPEAGIFVMSSCQDRIGDFVFNNGQVDVVDVACTDICTLASDALEIQPTTTLFDNSPKQRPWVERIGGQTNLPPGTDVAEALRCLLPMGINGCGFESQLESMYLGLVRAENAGESNYGFLRPDAVLAVLFVSDEADCSYNKNYAEIFEQDGNKVFWSDPSSSFPTSAVCWNAGVSCVGDPSNYDACTATNKDVNGSSGVADADAVLHPLSRFRGLLAGLEAQIQELQPGREVVVGLIGGVSQDGAPFYADVSDTDPPFQDSFGIGPGCTAPNPNDPNSPTQAVPPVRMYELAEDFSAGTSYSICDADLSGGLSAFAARITDQLP